jgi:ubiquinone/menaquinone biosynthesis C-methylase UbiE
MDYHEERGRERQLAQIRGAYAGYERSGRHRLWDPHNRGFARISADRDRRILKLLQQSTVGRRAAKILDLGCGTGEAARFAHRDLSANWTGVDLLPEVLEIARAKYPWARFVEASADALPFEAGWFDAVLASTLFSSLPSAEFERSVVEEIARVLRPGGWLVWYDLRYGNPRNPHVHGLDRAAVVSLFAGWHAELDTMTLLPPVARRLGRFTSLVYRPLERISPLRSHLIGRLQRPA